MSSTDSTSSAAPTASTVSAPSTGGKLCSACQRTMHVSAFSSTQAKAPAKSRKCMECVVNGKSSVETPTTHPSASTSVPSSSASASSITPTPATDSLVAKKKKKSNTPGAIARERAAARQASNGQPSALAAKANELLASLEAAGVKGVKKNGGKDATSSSTATAAKKDTIFNTKHRSNDQSGKLSLLDADEADFLPAAESALVEVFRRFASSCSSDTPRDELGWSLADIQSFARATNGKEFTTEELMEIQDNLEHDDQGRLTCQGFLDFYHLQTTSHVS